MSDDAEQQPPAARTDPPGEAVTAWATIDGGGLVTEWSDGARRLLGHRAAEVVGRPATELFAGTVSDDILRTFATATRWNGQLPLLRRDGRMVRVGLLARRRTPADGSREWYVVSPQPLDARPPDDDRLAWWSFAQGPCTLAIYDTDLRLWRGNANMERVVGLRQEEIRGLRPSEIAPGPSGERAERAMRSVILTGRPRTLEESMRLPGQTEEHAWSVSMSPLTDDTGKVCGVCLAAHDMTEQVRARKRLALLNEASTRIGSTLDIMRTAQELAEVSVPHLADFVVVDLLPGIESGGEPAAGRLDGVVTLRRGASHSVLPGAPETVVERGGLAAHPANSAATQCLAEGRPVVRAVTEDVLDRWSKEAPARVAKMRTYAFHSILAVPLRARGTTLGVVSFCRHVTEEPFAEDDTLLAEEMTARAAVCIDNARRYTRERETSLTLQRSLLPRRPPRNAAVEVAWRYLPAGSQARVGGDWFDVIPLSGARVALVVGDVVGHGLQASATMGRLRTAVRTLADVDLAPEELLTRLDELVSHLSDGSDGTEPGDGALPDYDRAEVGRTDTGPGEVGATCIYVVYDPVSRRCSLARAGHPPPALLIPGGTAHTVDLPGGPLLGLGGVPFEAAEIELPEGSLLALYTDGLVESRTRDIDEGIEAMCAALDPTTASLEELCDAVLKRMLPDGPADDVALLLARTRALGARQVATWELPADPAVVAEARSNASAQLTAWGHDEVAFATELIVSELVTNAIRHAAPPIQLRLIEDRNLICEVSDGSSAAPHLRRARSFDEGGRGLMMVAQLSDRWGTRHTGSGKTIWAEQALRE